jgi:hypothetical protein
MFDFWEADLTEEETVALLDQAESEIRKRKLVTPAILALEMHKPLCFVGAHMAMASAPFLVPIFGFSFVNNYSRLLLKRENVEMLIQRLEAKPAQVSLSAEDTCAT